MANDSDILSEAKEAFQLAADAEADNRREAEDDIRFARLSEQWPSDIRAQREREGRPCLTINKLQSHIRQVVNDARQNKPSVKVHPVDSGADIDTAEIYDGLIRHIQTASGADVAYDTAAECAVSSGVGYWRIGLDYAREDTFDLDITIKRVGNPFAVYGDPYSTAADSSDWNTAFVVENVPKALFKRLYPKASETSWDGVEWSKVGEPWHSGDEIMVAEYWTREEYDKEIIRLQDGTVLAADDLARNQELAALVASGVMPVVASRKARCFKVRQHTITAAEVLKSEDWLGQYIPIVPVYGDEVNLMGKRYFRSLIRDAKDPQRMHNFWRTAATEMTALAPKVPFIGPVGAFATDADKWATANKVSHAYLEYDPVPQAAGDKPQRQPLDGGAAAGAIQEALMASDDIKAVTGQHDASLGARSNETSGRAIIARQREGDISTFHFQDNVSRAIRHTGVILIDLIPKVYDKPRIIRVLGEDNKPETAPINQPVPVTNPETGQPQPEMGPDGQPIMAPNPQTGILEPKVMTKFYDLKAGKYDLSVKAGPSFTTRREEAAYSMNEALRAWPDAGPVILPELAKNLDWPGADEIAEKLAALAPKPDGGVPPELKQAIEELEAKHAAMEQENAALKADKTGEQAKLQIEAQKAEQDGQLKAAEIANERERLELDRERLRIEFFKAQTDRMQAMKPEPAPIKPRPREAA